MAVIYISQMRAPLRAQEFVCIVCRKVNACVLFHDDVVSLDESHDLVVVYLFAEG